MKKNVIIPAIIIPILLIVTYFTVIREFVYNNKGLKSVTPTVQQTEEVQIKSSMQISSTVFENNKMIPKKFTCDGEGVNPELTFSQIPPKAKSLTLIVDDPDAPKETFTHWVVYNISPQVKIIPENSIPQDAVLGITSIGKPGFIGSCSPPASPALRLGGSNRGESGTHRYFFKLYALDTRLNLSENTSSEEVEKTMEGHIIETAQIIGLYSRN